MEIIKKIFCIIILILLYAGVFGQEKNYYLVLPEDISVKYQRKIHRAEKYVKRGIEVLVDVNKAEEALEKAEGKTDINPIRLAHSRERLYRLKLKASTYFEDAHRIQYRALKRYLREEHSSEFEQIQDEIVKQFRRGSVLRKRAENNIPGRNPVNLLREAARHEKEALQQMVMVFKRGDESLDFIVKNEKDSISISEEVSALVSKTADSMKPVIEEHVERIHEERKEKINVFFSIQFLATRKPVSNERVRDIYSGNLPVIKDISEGWYRFSAGKFETFEKARGRMYQDEIYGFIVAFRGDERISIKKARSLLKED